MLYKKYQNKTVPEIFGVCFVSQKKNVKECRMKEKETMMNYKKYTRQYFMPPERCMDWADKEYVDHAPVWCSVDLRDGNQALVVPMTLQQKLDFFQMLVKIGFKENEVGFPAASETEYEFLRALIEQDLIPDDLFAERGEAQQIQFDASNQAALNYLKFAKQLAHPGF